MATFIDRTNKQPYPFGLVSQIICPSRVAGSFQILFKAFITLHTVHQLNWDFLFTLPLVMINYEKPGNPANRKVKAAKYILSP